MADTAFVVVTKNWFNAWGVRRILKGDATNDSAEDTHLIVARIRETNDPHGVWLTHIDSAIIKANESPLRMELMVPWSAIVAIGIVTHQNAPIVGFPSDASTSVLTDQPLGT